MSESQRSQFSFLWPLAALFIGGAFVLPGKAPGGQPTKLGAATSGAGAVITGSALDGRPRTQEPHDAYDLLAEAIGVDVTAGSVITSLRQDLPLLRSQIALAGSCPGKLESDPVAKLLDALESEAPSDLAGDQAAGSRGRTVSAWTDSKLKGCPAEFVYAIERFSDAFDPKRREEVARGRIEDALAGKQVQSLIVFVPDPIDSNVRSIFDSLVESLQIAVANSGFQLDRFFLPDFDPDPDAEHPHASEHERNPGVILFHKERGDRTTVEGYLVVLLVPEIPTIGFHRDAFDAAVEFALHWAARSDVTGYAPRSLRILGPTFSGTAPILRQALESLPWRNRRVAVNVLSGSASNFKNQRALTFDTDRISSTFHAVVVPDTVADRALRSFLPTTSILRPITAGFFEANTAYGRSLSAGEDDSLTFGFPMHISRLETIRAQELAASRNDRAAEAARASIDFEEPRRSTDRFPSVTPKMSAAEVETQLAGVIHAASRARTTAIGLFATDARDKLFLAREIEQRMLNPLLFTIESDLRYVHPDFSAFMRGTLVASSYPLFPRTRDSDHIEQFSSTATQGVYNAAVALLNYDPQGNPLECGAPPLLDYSCTLPGTDKLGPCLWLSVVGKDAIWPLRRVDLSTDAASAGYVFPVQPSVTARRPPRTQGADTVVVLSLLINLAALATVFLCVCANTPLRVKLERVRRSTLLRVFAPPATRDPEDAFYHGRFLLACIHATLVVTTFFLAMLLARTWGAGFTGLFECLELTLAWSVTGSTELLAIALFVVLLVRNLGNPLAWDRRRLAGSILVLADLAGLAALFDYLGSVLARGPEHALMFYERVTHPASWVSPLTPLVLVVLPTYAWSIVHLAWHRRANPRKVLNGFVSLRGLVTGLGESDRTVEMFDRGPGGAVRTSGIVGLTCLVGFLVGVWVQHGVGAFEGRAFLTFFLLAWIVAQALLLLTLFQARSLWNRLATLLRGMAAHPAVDAYRTLSEGPLVDPLAIREPGLLDLEGPIRLAHQLAALPPARVVPAGLAAELRSLRLGPSCSLQCERDRLSWLDTGTYEQLLATSQRVLRAAEPYWSGAVSRPEANTADGIWLVKAEEMTASVLLLHVRELMARILKSLHFAFVGQAVLLCSHLFFPFQARRLLLGVDWLLVLGSLAAAWATFLQAQRDDVLSRVTNQTSGKVNFGWELIRRILLYAIVPLLSYFAIQFPDIAAGLTHWLEPIRKAIT